MKSFFDYNKNELKEEIKGSSKIIVSRPTAGDKFVLCNNQQYRFFHLKSW